MLSNQAIKAFIAIDETAMRLVFICLALHPFALPVHVIATIHPVQNTRQYKQQITQAVQVLAWCILQRLSRTERHHGPLSPAGHRATDMG